MDSKSYFDTMSKKVPIGEWKNYIKASVVKKQVEEKKQKKREIEAYLKGLKKFISIPIMIGVSAAFIMFLLYGKREVIRVILSWIIGTMLIASVVPYIVGYIQKKLL